MQNIFHSTQLGKCSGVHSSFLSPTPVRETVQHCFGVSTILAEESSVCFPKQRRAQIQPSFTLDAVSVEWSLGISRFQAPTSARFRGTRPKTVVKRHFIHLPHSNPFWMRMFLSDDGEGFGRLDLGCCDGTDFWGQLSGGICAGSGGCGCVGSMGEIVHETNLFHRGEWTRMRFCFLFDTSDFFKWRKHKWNEGSWGNQFLNCETRFHGCDTGFLITETKFLNFQDRSCGQENSKVVRRRFNFSRHSSNILRRAVGWVLWC